MTGAASNQISTSEPVNLFGSHASAADGVSTLAALIPHEVLTEKAHNGNREVG